ncbi:MAG: GxxExxY protein [Saprospiraceae bacterium]
MHENAISKLILDASFKVHKTLGPGLLESCYEQALKIELDNLGLKVETKFLFHSSMEILGEKLGLEPT